MSTLYRTLDPQGESHAVKIVVTIPPSPRTDPAAVDYIADNPTDSTHHSVNARGSRLPALMRDCRTAAAHLPTEMVVVAEVPDEGDSSRHSDVIERELGLSPGTVESAWEREESFRISLIDRRDSVLADAAHTAVGRPVFVTPRGRLFYADSATPAETHLPQIPAVRETLADALVTSSPAEAYRIASHAADAAAWTPGDRALAATSLADSDDFGDHDPITSIPAQVLRPGPSWGFTPTPTEDGRAPVPRSNDIARVLPDDGNEDPHRVNAARQRYGKVVRPIERREGHDQIHAIPAGVAVLFAVIQAMTSDHDQWPGVAADERADDIFELHKVTRISDGGVTTRKIRVEGAEYRDLRSCEDVLVLPRDGHRYPERFHAAERRCDLETSDSSKLKLTGHALVRPRSHGGSFSVDLLTQFYGILDHFDAVYLADGNNEGDGFEDDGVLAEQYRSVIDPMVSAELDQIAGDLTRQAALETGFAQQLVNTGDLLDWLRGCDEPPTVADTHRDGCITTHLGCFVYGGTGTMELGTHPLSDSDLEGLWHLSRPRTGNYIDKRLRDLLHSMRGHYGVTTEDMTERGLLAE